MTKEELVLRLKPQMIKHLSDNWKTVTLHYKKGDESSNYGLTYLDSENKINSVCPSLYSLGPQGNSAIGKYFQEINKTNKYNEIKITIDSSGDSFIKNFWNNEIFERDKSGDLIKRQILEINNEADFSRFDYITNQNLLTTKICDIPFTEEMVSASFTRLFSLFNKTPQVIDNGFVQFIKDNSNNNIFSLELNQFGLAYFTDKTTSNIQESVSIFHNTLFSDLLQLKICKAQIKTDYNVIEIGFDGNTPFINVIVE